RLSAGDDLAFCELVEGYESRIRSVIYGILRNREDADEIAQEVFAKVYFSIKGFGARSSLYTWIYRIAVNECYGYLRKKRFKLVYPNDSPDDTLSLRMEAIMDGRPTPIELPCSGTLLTSYWHVSRKTIVGCLSRKRSKASL